MKLCSQTCGEEFVLESPPVLNYTLVNERHNKLLPVYLIIILKSAFHNSIIRPPWLNSRW
jgi:hypothetical protein